MGDSPYLTGLLGGKLGEAPELLQDRITENDDDVPDRFVGLCFPFT